MVTITRKKILSICLLGGILALSKLFGQDIEIEKLKINTSETSEYAPIVEDSILYFVSNRKANLLVTYLDQHQNILFSVFSTPLLPDGNTGKIKLFAPAGQPRFNAGPITFSGNGSLLIATHNRWDKKQKSNKTNPLVLYSAQNNGSAWNNYNKLNFQISSRASIGQPSLSVDGNQLYFASDMEGGYGETDIYISKKTSDGWSTPKNLGPIINTPGKELFPFIHPSGKLYFTSNGHEGQGNLDIYYIDTNHPNAKPVQLPEPINSVHNDFSIYIGSDETKGFFASDRDGNDDIYSFTVPDIACSNPEKVEEPNFCFTFFENGPFKTDTLPYIYRWNFGDGHEAEGLEADHCFPGPGEYHIQLNVIDTLLNQELFSVASYTLNLEPKKQIWFQIPDTINQGSELRLEAILQGYNEGPDHTLFLWDFGTGDLLLGQKVSYIYSKPGRYRIVCSTQLNNNRRICFYREIEVTDPQQ